MLAIETMHLKLSSAKIVCRILMLTSRTTFSIQTNSVDPDQTAPRGVLNGLTGDTVDNILSLLAAEEISPKTKKFSKSL